MSICPQSDNFEDIRAWAMEDAPELDGENSSEKKNLSEICLRFGHDWVRIQPQKNSGKKLTKLEKRQQRQECKKYFKNRYLSEPQPVGFLLSGVLFTIILNAVIGWVVRRLLDDWIHQQ